jgi:RNA polymerase sigma factor (sigma-70 family)
MVARDTDVQHQADARQRYETARQRLTGELGDRVQALVGVGPSALVSTEPTYEQRAAVIEAGLDLIVPLRRFVEGELKMWIDPGLIDRRAIEPDEIVANVYLQSVEQADSAPVARAFYTWLRRIARREVRAAVLALEEHGERETSMYDFIVEADEGWPAEINQLIDLLADPAAILPDDFVERQEIHEFYASLLARLPEQWREVFLMKVVDGWNSDEISTIEGIDRQQVDSKVDMSREFLRSWLEDARREDDL